MDYHSETPKKCPPKNAGKPDGLYYRIVYHNPPVAKDFTIWVLEKKNRHLLEERKKQNHCNSFAVSVWATEEGAEHLRGLFKRPLEQKAKGKFIGIAKVQLDANSGVIMKTGSNPFHYDLWPYTRCCLEKNVKGVEEV